MIKEGQVPPTVLDARLERTPTRQVCIISIKKNIYGRLDSERHRGRKLLLTLHYRVHVAVLYDFWGAGRPSYPQDEIWTCLVCY